MADQSSDDLSKVLKKNGLARAADCKRSNQELQKYLDKFKSGRTGEPQQLPGSAGEKSELVKNVAKLLEKEQKIAKISRTYTSLQQPSNALLRVNTRQLGGDALGTAVIAGQVLLMALAGYLDRKR